MIRIGWLPAANCCTRNSLSSCNRATLSLPRTGRPKSSLIMESSCSEFTRVLNTLASTTRSYFFLSRLRIRVVFPEPTSPVRRMNPAPSLMP